MVAGGNSVSVGCVAKLALHSLYLSACCHHTHTRTQSKTIIKQTRVSNNNNNNNNYLF
jgi:hypothetical protein